MEFISVIPGTVERSLQGNFIYSHDAQTQQLLNELLQAMQSPRDEAEALWSRANSFVLVSRETLDQLGVLQRIDREVVGVSLPHPSSSGETSSNETASDLSAAQLAGLEREILAIFEATRYAKRSLGRIEITSALAECLAARLPMVLEVEKTAHRLRSWSSAPDLAAQWGSLAVGRAVHAGESASSRASSADAAETLLIHFQSWANLRRVRVEI